MITVGTQAGQILLCRRMSKHIQVHRRSDKNRRLTREVRRHQHIIRHPVRHLSDRRSRSRSDKHRIGPQSQIDVTVPRAVAVGEKLTDYRLTAQGGQGQRRDKLFRRRCHHHLYLRSIFYQSTNQICSLIGSNTACDAQDDFFPSHTFTTNSFASYYLCP